MADPQFSAAQYGQAARSLLPRGRAWNREDGSNQGAFCDALGTVYAQQDADSLQMLADFFPATATQGIDEWNSSLGLPDECSGEPANQAANQQQILARLIASGGQSVPYYIALAAALGFEITITEFTPTEPGADAPAGLIQNSADWAHTWRVNVLNTPTMAGIAAIIEHADVIAASGKAGTGGVGAGAALEAADVTSGVGSAPSAGAILECLLERYKPAHTQFYIVDGSSPSSSSRLFNTEDDVSEPLYIVTETR